MAIRSWVRDVSWLRWVVLAFVVALAAFVFSLLLSVQQDKALVVAENERVLEELADAKAQNEQVLSELAEVKAQNVQMGDLLRRLIEANDEERAVILEELRQRNDGSENSDSGTDGSQGPRSSPRPQSSPSPSPSPRPPPPSPSPRPSPSPSPSPSPDPIPDVCIGDICVGGRYSRAL